MNGPFHPGDRVYWWRRISGLLEYPYRAKVLTVGPKRIKVSVEEPDGGSERVIRHVRLERLQPIERFYVKACVRDPRILEPAASWGRFTRFLEVGEDLLALRHVELFENGQVLSYDRSHWVDDFGTLADARINRNQKPGRWGWWEIIGADEFERVWSVARASPTWPQQVTAAQMSRLGLGDVPLWLTVRRWRPEPLTSKGS